jgi:hypothetical protein
MLPYTAAKPTRTDASEELRGRIPGWGVDMNPADRPALPKEALNLQATGAHWQFPERQPEKWPRERSNEHSMLPPVFGTVCPPKGLSGVIRRYAFRFSEGRARHWLLLMGADRVDVIESRIAALLQGRPDRRVYQSGVLSELKYGGLRSRIGRHRADVRHHWIDALWFAAPYLVAAGTFYLLAKRRSASRRSP